MALGVTPKIGIKEAELLSLYKEKDDLSQLPEYLVSCSRYGNTEGVT